MARKPATFSTLNFSFFEVLGSLTRNDTAPCSDHAGEFLLDIGLLDDAPELLGTLWKGGRDLVGGRLEILRLLLVIHLFHLIYTEII